MQRPIIEPPDHARLVAELPNIERMTATDRLSLARERRKVQLEACRERERQLPPPRPRMPRLVFSPEVALLEATSRADAVEIENILREGANPDSCNEDGLTALHQASIDNNERIVELLLNYAANVNAKDTELWTPLHAAACCDYLAIVRLLIRHGADLLAVNADGNMPYDLCEDESHTLDYIEQEMFNQNITQEIINDMRTKPETEMLIDMKTKHQRGESLSFRYPDGSTYLHIAAAHGYYTVAAFLLRCGVETSLRDNDLWQPIHAAANWNQPELIELLCEYGADIDAKTQSQETVLDLAQDDQTRQVILTLQQTEARKRRHAFGVRDSRRQSRKRKKFESPQQPQIPATNGQTDNPFSARGTIRRQSLRDRNGITWARLDAQNENSNLMRSWSKEDVSNSYMDEVSNFPTGPQRAASLTETGRKSRDSPNKRVLNKSGNSKVKAHGEDEWYKKLEANASNDYEDDDETHGASNLAKATRGRSSTKRKKKKPDQLYEMNDVNTPTVTNALNGKNGGVYGAANSHSVDKTKCCCVIL
ncbi:hypothetical protein M3Y98_00509600 [Aphelenchoides besseyi]|nr:hypothetical protein M3Y98_00509600 [Aphelenchoides besseyi]KAI6207838.1 hypothetical protein M3Y96_00051400 [Aphelenchoides besseyi]